MAAGLVPVDIPTMRLAVQPQPSRVDSQPNPLNKMIPFIELGKGQLINQQIINARNVDIYADQHGNKQVDMNKNPDGLKVVLGDVGDRGDESWKRVQEVMKLVKEGKCIFVLGNHEAMFMAAMTEDPTGANRDKIQAMFWLVNGGDMTAEQAGANLTEYNKLWKQEIPANADPNDPDVIEKAKFDLAQRLGKIIQNGPAKQGGPNFAAENMVYQNALQQAGAIQGGLLQSPELSNYAKELAQNAEPFVVVNGALLVHGNVRGVEDLKFMEQVRKDLRSPDPNVRARAVQSLNDGYVDTKGQVQDSPLWSRDYSRFADPAKAGQVRQEINDYLGQGNAERPGVKVEVVLVGHTPVDGLRRKGILNNAMRTNRSRDRSADPKIVLMDYHAYSGGVQAKMHMEMDASGKNRMLLVNDVNDSPLPDLQGNKVSAQWEIQGIAFIATEPLKPADVAQAEDAKRQLDKLAQENKISALGWPQIRVLNVESLLADGDPANNIPQGALRKAGWSNDESTRKLLNNLKQHAQNLSEETLRRIQQDLKMDANRLITISPEEFQATADRLQQVLHMNDGAQALEMLKASKDLVIERKAAQNTQTEAAAAAQTARATTLSAAESALIGQMSREAALAIISNDAFRGFMLDQYNTILYQLKQDVAAGRMGADEADQLIREKLNPVIDFVRNGDVNRKKDLDQLVANGKITKAQRTTIEQDVRIALLQYEINQLTTEDAKVISSSRGDPKVEIKKKQDELKTLQEARAGVKEKDDSVPINMVVNVASMICGVAANSPEAQAVENNPIGAVSGLVGRVIDSKNPQVEIDALVGRVGQGLSLNEAQAQELKNKMDEAFKQMMHMKEMIDGKEKTTGEVIGGFLKMGGAISLIAILITFIKSLTGSGLISNGPPEH